LRPGERAGNALQIGIAPPATRRLKAVRDHRARVIVAFRSAQETTFCGAKATLGHVRQSRTTI
jgi:hypothetical protein